LPSSRQSRTAGWSKKTGWCVQAIVSCPAQPIATALTPPEKPAYRCGSTTPTATTRSARATVSFMAMAPPAAVAPSVTLV